MPSLAGFVNQKYIIINWAKTKEVYNIERASYRCTVIAVCDGCGGESPKLITRVSDVNGDIYPYKCPKCVAKARKPQVFSPERRKKISQNNKNLWKDESFKKKVLENRAKVQEKASAKASASMKKKWQDKGYRNKVTDSVKSVGHVISEKAKASWTDERKAKAAHEFSIRSKKLWMNGEYRKRVTSSINSEECLAKLRESSSKPENIQRCLENISRITEMWDDPAYFAKMAKIASDRWLDPEYREKMAQARANTPIVSSLQIILYSVLDDLGVGYFRERENGQSDPACLIGPYNFDCVVPREGQTTLLIECQGDYWHNLPDTKSRDKAKATYISKYFADKYEIKYIWEHEFKTKDRVIETIKRWLGVSAPVENFSFSELEIKECPPQHYRDLLSKYHYLANAGRGGIAYGAYLKNELIAVCVFSPLVRQNIKTGDYTLDESRELSRLCIHPRYQKRNFASWFVSRCMKMLDPKYRLIISYCDTTFNHDGATYKACNFKQDGETKADYWYVDNKGRVIRKNAYMIMPRQPVSPNLLMLLNMVI